jgi:hypothetical protein
MPLIATLLYWKASYFKSKDQPQTVDAIAALKSTPPTSCFIKVR